MIASIFAIILTIFSGSQNLASATTLSNLNKTNHISKADLCSGPFLTPFCGKILGKCSISHQSQSVVRFEPQSSYGIVAAPKSVGEETKESEKHLFAYSYSVAKASPTPEVSNQNITPTPTVSVQSAVAYNVEAAEPVVTGGLNPEVIFTMVNQIRTNAGLAPFEKDDRLCAIANERAPELYNEIYVNGNMHAGLARRQPSIPYWVTENMISQQTEQQAVNWWMNSPVHRSAILGNYSHGCVSCSGNNCAMLFTSFIPK